jgi:hypothetical protein
MSVFYLLSDAYMHLQVVILIAHPIIPSGKHTKNYGKSSFLIGTSTISMAVFNTYVSLPGGNSHESTLALIFGKSAVRGWVFAERPSTKLGGYVPISK